MSRPEITVNAERTKLTIVRREEMSFRPSALALLRKIEAHDDLTEDEKEGDDISLLYGWGVLDKQPMTWNETHHLNSFGYEVLRALKDVQV